MEGIYYKDGVYVLIDTNEKNDACIYHYKFNYKTSLFGGRVKIKTDYYGKALLSVDGIPIIRIENPEIHSRSLTRTLINSDLALDVIISHLNGIEIHGVDAFLENYKKSIEFLYSELKELNQKTETLLNSQQDEEERNNLLSEIDDIKILLMAVLTVLFGLYSFMKAGLENEKVTSIYQSIKDSLI